jgi:hypothetical protein
MNPSPSLACLAVTALGSVALALAAPAALAASAAEKAKESGCIEKPKVVEGSTYKCATSSGVQAYFNADEVGTPARASGSAAVAARKSPTPAGFPKVDTETQKVRDDIRKKVLNEELAAEQKLLADARVAYADGAPPPLPDEKADADKYRTRIARLRQSMGLHEKNVEALKKELSMVK